jgi:CHAP domain
MSDWWEVPYRGGPMVDVKGFPRALYPPDARKYGHPGSIDGPDVEAYQRTVARAGRWPWGTFNQTYSNGFAHGTGGNVRNTGVAGVQRQGAPRLDDTGWIGEKTFNLLRSIRVPAGPHEGEMAMDSYSAKLINDAWDMFGGHEPPPPPSSTVRELALAMAVTQLGVKESPPNSNQVLYSEWYSMIGPWCAMFCTWCFDKAGGSPSFQQGSSYAYVPYIVGDARAKRRGLSTTDSPIPGDLVCYDWEWNTEYDHVGIFEGWTSGSYFTALEGNTSASGSQSNGGEVCRKQRSPAGQGTVFVRVTEP